MLNSFEGNYSTQICHNITGLLNTQIMNYRSKANVG